MGTALVLGATGGVGGAVTRAMLARGWHVTALVRDPRRAAVTWGTSVAPDWQAGDAMNRADVVRAAEGTSVIVHAVNPPGYHGWDRLVLPMLDNTLAAARDAGARIVLPGTIYNYDPRLAPVVDETTPQHPRGRKGAIRVEMERRLAKAAPEVRSLVVRAGDFFGPGADQSWFAQALAKLPLARIVNPGTAGVGHAWAYLPDLAEPSSACSNCRRIACCRMSGCSFPATTTSRGWNGGGGSPRLGPRRPTRAPLPVGVDAGARPVWWVPA